MKLEFLKWVAARPRRVAETRQAWSSTCPLNCAWEDAISEDLVAHAPGGLLVLTERGRALLPDTTLPQSLGLIDETAGVSYARRAAALPRPSAHYQRPPVERRKSP